MADYIKSPVFQLKCIELILHLVAIAFMIFSLLPSSASVFLTEIGHFTLFGFFLLDLLIIGGFFLREPVSKFLILVVSLSGAVFSLVTAVILLVGWRDQDSGRLLFSAIATILSVLVYAGDSYYIIRFAAD